MKDTPAYNILMGVLSKDGKVTWVDFWDEVELSDIDESLDILKVQYPKCKFRVIKTEVTLIKEI